MDRFNVARFALSALKIGTVAIVMGMITDYKILTYYNYWFGLVLCITRFLTRNYISDSLTVKLNALDGGDPNTAIDITVPTGWDLFRVFYSIYRGISLFMILYTL